MFKTLMRYIAITLMLACCLLSQLNSRVQAKTSSIQKRSTSIHSVKDWFLSTGDWQSDPQIYVCEFGSGKDTVVMLHGGWGGDYSGMFMAVANLGTEFHFIFYDQRGSLRSPFPDSLISFDEHIQDVERLRSELPIKKLTIVGHSMGAVLASAYAARYPEHIIVLFC
jgi:proline iminopeptidase